ncbi:MAG: histone deacetylase [Cytophagales bacterium]|nr:histone deacetylase [Cytophagales bacterium]
MLKIAWAPIYNHPLPEGHRFPMEKYELLPRQLVHEGVVDESAFFSPRKLEEFEILKVHEYTYWRKLLTLDLTRQEERRSGFPISQQLVEREITINGGTLQCAEYALEWGVAMNIAGGTHHAYADRAEGFCLLNDIAIAARHLIDNQLAKQVLVVDLDVHQGNGTARIFQDDPRVFTFSMHGAHNYPLKKELSDLDIPLNDGIKDDEYLSLLRQTLGDLIDRVKPDFIFYQSGVDILASDKLGRLGVSPEGCAERDLMVFEKMYEYGLPVVAAMGGGYSKDIKVILDAHANTYRAAVQMYF